PSAWLRAAWAKAVLNTVTVGMPRRSSSTASADRGRGSTISEALHDGIAFGELSDIRLAEVILRRKFADDWPNDDAEPASELGGDARQKEIRIELAVIEEAEALACEVPKPGSGRDGWGFLGDGGIEHEPHVFGFLTSSWILLDPI